MKPASSSFTNYKLQWYSKWFILHLKCCPLSHTAVFLFFFGGILGKGRSICGIPLTANFCFFIINGGHTESGTGFLQSFNK